MDSTNFSTKLIDWYGKNKRDLPWRNEQNPYKIWLSEIILQQTRVVQGLPYYNRFIQLFPTVQDLAQADEKEVLRAWQGLGYYSRARNLHKCAKIIVEKFEGIFPKTYEQLLTLPGIGPYTAAALASFSYYERVAVVDGNVYRVLARVFGLSYDIALGKEQKKFWKKANELISVTDPASFNQAIMEFGAMHCTPASPKCEECVFNVECYARIHHKQQSLPVKTKKVKIRKRHFNYLVFTCNDKIILHERQAKDIWQGLYEFILLERERLLSMEEILNIDFVKQLNLQILQVEESQSYKHILSHQHIHARFFLIKLKSTISSSKLNAHYYTEDQILDLPKPVLISSYLNEAIFSS